MVDLFRLRPFAFVPASGRQIPHYVPTAARLIFWPLLVLALMSVALQFGAWHAEFKIAEPFAPETNFGYLLLMLAGLGTVMTWLTGSTVLYRPLLESNERSLRRLLVRCGFPIAACAFVFCISAMWAGIIRPGDFHYANLGGLVPFSDAGGYLAAAFDQVRNGVWNDGAFRRPLAAGFRSVLGLSMHVSNTCHPAVIRISPRPAAPTCSSSPTSLRSAAS
jgi:hypothetical protein